jgi:hypothetical protein
MKKVKKSTLNLNKKVISDFSKKYVNGGAFSRHCSISDYCGNGSGTYEGSFCVCK